MKSIAKIVFVLVFLFLVSSCVFSPGMDMHSGMKKGDGLKYVQIDKFTYVPVFEITEDLLESIDQNRRDNTKKIPLGLLNYEAGPYKIGIGDILSVVVWGQPELLSQSAGDNPIMLRQVRDDGSFFFPYAGQIIADGYTREEVRVELTSKLSRFFNDPQVDVSIEMFNSQNVVVSGQFSKPVTIPLTAVPLTLSRALSEAAGPSENADLTNLQLNRDGDLYTLNYHDLANSGQIHGIVLKNGDVIHLPLNLSNKAYVVGEVGKPEVLTLETGSITLTDALASAQGISSRTGSGNELYVVRGADTVTGEKAIYRLDASSPASFLLASQFYIKPQDVIFVGPSELTKWNRVISQLFPFASLLNVGDQISNR